MERPFFKVRKVLFRRGVTFLVVLYLLCFEVVSFSHEG